MRLVDDQQRRLRDRELVQHVRVGELLGGEEDELERLLGELGECRLALGRGDVRVELGGAAGGAGPQVVDLLALERDQGRDDHGGAGQQQPGDL